MSKLEDLIEILQKRDDFIIVGHINPDGDCIGSALGLVLGLRKLGKKASVLKNDSFPEIFNFLKLDKFLVEPAEMTEKTAVVLDCGDLERTGQKELLAGCQMIVNIDHHKTNNQFGTVNYINSAAAATAAIIYDLLLLLPLKLDSHIATALYAGIMTDTGSFRHSNTDSSCFRVAEDLVRQGAVPNDIYKNIYQQVNYSALLLLGRIIQQIKLEGENKIALASISQQLLAETQCTMDDTEGMISYLLSIKKVEAACLLKEKGPNTIRVSLRAKNDLDVSLVAEKFGGGGHAKAAGCTIHSSLSEAEKKIVVELLNALG